MKIEPNFNPGITQDHKFDSFVENKEHHNLPHNQLLKMYKVSSTTLSNRFFPAVGREKRINVDRATRDACIADPLFGEEGFPAPCTNKFLGEIYGLCQTTVGKHRRMYGVLSTDNRPLMEGNGRSPELKPWEKVNYALCGLTTSWGRPAGMEAHLESLK